MWSQGNLSQSIVKYSSHFSSYCLVVIFKDWHQNSSTHCCNFPLLFLTSLKTDQQSVWIFLPHSYVSATSFSKAFITQTVGSPSPFSCHVKHFCNAAKERNVIFTCCPMSCCELISKLPCWVAFVSPVKWQSGCL